MRKNTPSRERVEAVHAELRAHNFNKRAAALALKMPESSMHNLLDAGCRLYDIPVPAGRGNSANVGEAKGRRLLEITDGVLFVASDAHYWPGPPSTAHRALVKFLKKEKNLRAVVMNGDAHDFPQVSRHDVDWTDLPSVKDELEVVAERLGEIEKAAGKVPKFWLLGNHDARYEVYLSKNAPAVKSVPGTSLKDHYPLWTPGYSLFINDGPSGVVIKHRFKGGMHATQNNTLWAGRTMVTGHLHSQRISPISDLNGTRWGVDTGMLGDPYAPQFAYCEDNPRSWRAGFARLKWVSGRLLTPELVRVVEDGLVEFRGELIEV